VSGRRIVPNPNALPVGGNDTLLAPPVQYLASTDPDEAPPPPLGPGEEEVGRLVSEPAAIIGEEIDELSPEEQIMFATLLTCGRRSKTLHILDHTVVVQTLCASDDLRIGLYAKPYADTVGEQRAYQVAVAAAGLRTIDGKPLVQSLNVSPDEDAIFDQKVKVVEKMYPTVINRIYRAVLDAEKEFVELSTRLGKLSG
jgi:hypothetical protein